MEILVRTLEDEIIAFLEANDNQVNSKEDIVNLLSDPNSFTYFKYLYQTHSIENLLRKNEHEFNGFLIKVKPEERYHELYQIRLANPILIGVNSNLKEIPTKSAKELNKLGIDKIQDIEFFEFYESQLRLLKYFYDESQRKDLPQKQPIIELLKHLDSIRIKDFQDELMHLGKQSSDYMEVLDDSKKIVSKSSFTAFMDTEKIHIQLGIGKNLKFPVLLYFGFGNHYPFSRSISGNKTYENRFNRLDYMSFETSDLKEIEKELKLNPVIRKNNLLRLIDNSQQNYLKHFNKHFSYNLRANEFNGEGEIDTKYDSILMIPETIRTKSAALVAYKYFSNNFSFN